MTVSATISLPAPLPARTSGRRAWLAAATLAVTVGIACLSGPALAQGAPKVKFATSEGDFVVEVYPDKAPKTVENFLQYVKDKHYDGTIFHRVISNFMVQGGGFDASYAQKPTRSPVAHEGREALSKGGDKNVAGTLAMARTNDPNSASSQFFINVKDNDFLNPSAQAPGYTVFGKVISGMDVVNKIKSVPTGAAGPFSTDVPKTPVLIKSAAVVS
jgi:peptidyl-prolyl cis-trans isomerase A (cyclophilin A)